MFDFVNFELFAALIIYVGFIWVVMILFTQAYVKFQFWAISVSTNNKVHQVVVAVSTLVLNIPWIMGFWYDWKTTLLASVVLTALLPVVIKIVYAKTMRIIDETL